MLYTNLKHIESGIELSQRIREDENVVVICGQMEANSIPVFNTVENLETSYPYVKFYDMEFENPESLAIRNLPEYNNQSSKPFVVYFKNGKLVKATYGRQSKEQIRNIIEKEFTNKLALTIS
jgi:thioredoxin 1